jgi:hypothetical protein
MIGKRLTSEIKPNWLRIGGYWYPRGGIPIDVSHWPHPQEAVGSGSRRRALSRPRLGGPATEPIDTTPLFPLKRLISQF